MSLKRLPTPNADAGNWGTILNEYINQLSPTPKGGINTWTTGTRPSSLTVDDEGRTGINTDTNVIERWSGSGWSNTLTGAKGVICITDFGAIGDGVANDYNAVQVAFNYARDNNVVILVNGIFNCVNNVVTYYKNTSVLGFGTGKSKFYNARLKSYLFDSLIYNGYSTSSAHGCSFQDFCIDGGNIRLRAVLFLPLMMRPKLV